MLVKDIAKIYKCNPNTIGKYLTEYGIERRNEHSWTSEWNKILKKKYNTYDLSGEYGIGWTSNTNQEFYFDLEDYKKIKDYCWMESDEGYIISREPNTGKHVRMHNIVTGWKYVDHIKHRPNDNRKSQLREANDKFNSRNRSKPANNASGCKGVSWHKKNLKWQAYIGINGKQKCLGFFDNYDDAVAARKVADEYYYKEWSYENSMNNKEE